MLASPCCVQDEKSRALSHGGQFESGILFEVFNVLVNIGNSNRGTDSDTCGASYRNVISKAERQ